ncbi:MAG: glycerol-3-phosphate dehydrogenase/oxidase, partial [Chloroflexota bacterium]
MHKDRSQIFETLRENPEIDVLIVGAGINGIGTFRDLAYQGVRTVLIDKKDFCSGASAASSHMVHGGIRYLENGEFRLVREAVKERNRLIENAPHLVAPLATTIPIFNWTSGLLNAPLKFLNLLDRPSERGAIVIKLGLMMYDAYTSAQGTVPKHEFHMKQASMKQFPDLHPDLLCTATYYDAMMPSPERICMELLSDAQLTSDEAIALNYVSIGQAKGSSVEIIDELTNGRLSLTPKIVINAAGPWIDFANQEMGQQTEFIGGTKGSHLVLDHPKLLEAIQGREFFFENEDGRIVLIYPFKHRVMIGTSDLRIDHPDNAVCTEEEIDYFLEMVERVFPNIQVNRSHIVFSFSGVRPLPAAKTNTTGQISRDHKIETIPASTAANFPVLNLIGGKWTTFRAFSEKTADECLDELGRKRKISFISIYIGIFLVLTEV